MLQQKTVLFLGAGASEPFGFPLGTQLKDDVTNLLKTGTAEALRSAGLDSGLVSTFTEDLSGAIHGTIDTFLEERRSLRKVGAYSIADAILRSERQSVVHLRPIKDWYRSLFESIFPDGEWVETIPLKVVTLNYDRSLEYSMQEAVKIHWEDSKRARARGMLASIQFVHPHGVLGSLEEVPYGTPPEKHDLFKSAAERVQIITDVLDDAPAVKQAKECIEWAERVILLGIGYDMRSLKRFFPRPEGLKAKFYGTYFDDNGAKDRAKEYFGDKIRLTNNTCAKIMTDAKNLNWDLDRCCA